jgi:hypothetical protein
MMMVFGYSKDLIEEKPITIVDREIMQVCRWW